MRVLWLLPNLDFTSAARQASLVLPELVRAGDEVRVAVLQSGGGFTGLLKSTGVDVTELASPHDLTLRAWWALDRLLRDWRPDVIHAWRLPAMRALGLLRTVCGKRARYVMSQSQRGGGMHGLDRWLTSRLGASDPTIPLAVGPSSLTQERDPWKIVCMGRFDKSHSFFDAVWAFDVLRFVMPNLRLELIGSGPERARIEAFIHAAGRGRTGVQMHPASTDAIERLGSAAMVWVPSRAPAGEQVAFEAQAAGTPVVASRLLASVVTDGETGVLVPPGDPVQLAKVTRRLLEHPDELRRLGNAGRERVTREKSAALVAAKWREVYQRTV
ncbi:MAG: glycosyltransferase [Gemmataceae bacterium]